MRNRFWPSLRSLLPTGGKAQSQAKPVWPKFTESVPLTLLSPDLLCIFSPSTMLYYPIFRDWVQADGDRVGESAHIRPQPHRSFRKKEQTLIIVSFIYKDPSLNPPKLDVPHLQVLPLQS